MRLRLILSCFLLSVLAAAFYNAQNSTAAPNASRHLIGGYMFECKKFPDGSAVRVAVGGFSGTFYGSVRAEGDIGANAKCQGGNNVIRVRISRLELDYVGSGPHTRYSAVGPVASSTPYVHAVTASVSHILCARDLQVRIYFTVRMRDGALHSGSAQGPVFHHCAA